VCLAQVLLEHFCLKYLAFTSILSYTNIMYFIFSTEIGYVDFWTQPMLKEYKHTTMIVDYVRYYR